MKIIKNATTSMQSTCNGCHSVLEINVTDIQGGDVVNHFFVCAVCDKVNYVPLSSMPVAFRNNLPDDTGA